MNTITPLHLLPIKGVQPATPLERLLAEQIEDFCQENDRRSTTDPRSPVYGFGPRSSILTSTAQDFRDITPMEARLLVDQFRETHPRVVGYWNSLHPLYGLVERPEVARTYFHHYVLWPSVGPRGSES